MDRKYLLTAFGYGLLGLVLGIYMAASKNHGQAVTHAHILLIGFVVSFVYAVCHKLWLTGAIGRLGAVQFFLHQVGTVGVVVGLFLLYGGYANEAVLGPVLGAASLVVLASMIMMKVMVVRTRAT
ncbi:TonB-dependent receptor [Marinimicrobium sp. ABcell2]|uniref:TonB-dependent receptor n=1 Tax=Marinimicrobium sp. ABcell2 TaxID=3069751 RepID=UPI0027B6B962|nr:TonB-dependent receptor [Marinimicrobium sp. ABcell2]MDQ2076105.1 TonB-dependent receptor [Marinimicrobium sp. ABcell2]